MEVGEREEGVTGVSLKILKKKRKKLPQCMTVCLHISCMCVPMCVYGVPRGQKTVSDVPDLKIQMVANHHVSARN